MRAKKRDCKTFYCEAEFTTRLCFRALLVFQSWNCKFYFIKKNVLSFTRLYIFLESLQGSISAVRELPALGVEKNEGGVASDFDVIGKPVGGRIKLGDLHVRVILVSLSQF
jgi:hypothetical protein